MDVESILFVSSIFIRNSPTHSITRMQKKKASRKSLKEFVNLTLFISKG